MARRGSNAQNTAASTEAEVTPTDTQESTVSTDTIESTEVDTTELDAELTDTEAPVPGEDADESEAEAPVDAAKSDEIDLTAFDEAVASAVAEADDSTGDIAEAPLAAVTKAYRELPDLKAKNAARKSVGEAMKAAMDEMSLPRARAYLNIEKKALVAASGGTKAAATPRVPVDPTEAFVQKVAGLSLALGLAQGNVPEGVAADWQGRVETLYGEQFPAAQAVYTFAVTEPAEGEEKGDAPEAEAWVQGAVKLALGKAGKVGTSTKAPTSNGGPGYSGERRSIAAHIANAFADVEEGGFLTIAQIKAKPSEEYGTDSPSAGAVSARLFPKPPAKYNPAGLIEFGIEPVLDGNGKKGARKVAVAPTEG